MSVMPVLPRMRADLTMLELETMGQQISTLLIKGFTTAPAQHPSAPCVVMLPVLLDRFKFIIHRMGDLLPVKEPRARALHLRSNYGDLLDQLSAFMNSMWMAVEVEEYESCSCPEHERTDIKFFYGNWKEVHGQELRPLERVVYDVCFLLHTVYDSIHPTKLERKPKDGKRKEWPPSPSHLIPYGPQVAEAAFILWSHFSQNPTTICTFLRLRRLCPTLASSSERSTDLLTSIINLFIYRITSLQKIDLSKAGFARLKLIGGDVKELHYILRGGWILDRAKEPDFFRPHFEHFTTLYRAICPLVPLVPKLTFQAGERDTIIGTLAITAIAIHNVALSGPNPVPLHPDLYTYCKDMYESPDDGYGELIQGVWNMRYKPQCTEPTCTQENKGTKAHFKLCSACQVARYCSETCQKSDWKAHKSVCGPLKKLIAVSDPYYRMNLSPDLLSKETRSAFKKSLQASGLTEEEIKRLTDYTTQRARLPTEISPEDRALLAESHSLYEFDKV